MKFFHLSDLHIGKQLSGYSLRSVQEEVLSRIVALARDERPDAILICGDIYDKSVPSGEAYTVFDSFLNRLSDLEQEMAVLIIAGNHDSPERLNYAASFLKRHNIHVSVMPPIKPEEHLKKVTLTDRSGNVNFYLLPFMKPGYVRQLLESDSLMDYDSAFRAVIEREKIDLTERNVILAHQFFVSGNIRPETCESEQAVITAGGLDAIDSSALDKFDYAALGHIHGSQQVGRETVRYCGTPYKYSVSEERHIKSVTVVTMEGKGAPPEIRKVLLVVRPDVRREKGSLKEITARATEESRHDFVSITLTDEEEVFDFREQLEEVFDRIVEIKIDNSRTRDRLTREDEQIKILSPLETFGQFYEMIRRCPMTKEQESFMERIIEEVEQEERG